MVGVLGVPLRPSEYRSTRSTRSTRSRWWVSSEYSARSTSLKLKGYPVDYYQDHGGHSHLDWCHIIGKGLVSFLGKDNTCNSKQRTSRWS